MKKNVLYVIIILFIFSGCQTDLVGLDSKLWININLSAAPEYIEMKDSSYDFDSEKYSLSPEADFQYGFSSGSMVFYTLLPINKSKAYVLGSLEGESVNCLDYENRMTRGSIPEIFLNNYICLKSNMGQMILLKIINIRSDYIELEYQIQN